MTQFDVSVGISPRQSFESWAKFIAELEEEGVRRAWVIDSQLAMKDVYAGLVVAALNTRRIGLGTGVTNAVTGTALRFRSPHSFCSWPARLPLSR